MQELSQDIVRKLLDYNPETGNMTWRPRHAEDFDEEYRARVWNTRYAGKTAGLIRSVTCGYYYKQVSIFGKGYPLHRVIWLWMTGCWPKDEIDHIDRDGTNNKWKNLREVTSAGNSRNLSMPKNNTSGVTGVSWIKKKNKWRARVQIDGKDHHVGFFEKDDLDLAAMAIMEFRIEKGFHPTHGIFPCYYHQQTDGELLCNHPK